MPSIHSSHEALKINTKDQKDQNHSGDQSCVQYTKTLQASVTARSRSRLGADRKLSRKSEVKVTMGHLAGHTAGFQKTRNRKTSPK